MRMSGKGADPGGALKASLCLAGMLFWLAQAVAKPVVIYPRPESVDDARTSYPVALLRLSLFKAGDAYRLAPSPVRTQQGRSMRLLEQGKLIDLVWTVTSHERERTLLPVRIPIDRGLIGWRLLLIRSQDSARMAAVRTKAALAPWRAGQGHDWPDAEVLRANGLDVHTSTSYARLFNMLERGHIEYFPRSVGEIWNELDARASLPLSVAEGIVLHYPEALYFFVNRSNQALAVAIERGLRMAIADGSMDALFERYYGAAIARAALGRRTVLALHNPLLPAATPLNDPTLWWRLAGPR